MMLDQRVPFHALNNDPTFSACGMATEVFESQTFDLKLWADPLEPALESC